MVIPLLYGLIQQRPGFVVLLLPAGQLFQRASLLGHSLTLSADLLLLRQQVVMLCL